MSHTGHGSFPLFDTVLNVTDNPAYLCLYDPDFHSLKVFSLQLFKIIHKPCFDLLNMLEQPENPLTICLNPLHSYFVAKQEREIKVRS